MKRVTIMMPPEHAMRLKKKAEAEGRTMGAQACKDMNMPMRGGPGSKMAARRRAPVKNGMKRKGKM